MSSNRSASSVSVTAMASHLGAPALEHGGDLAAARELFPGAPEPFIDLSTGINPYCYPIPQLPADVFTRLPERAAIDRLAAIAAAAYGAPSPAHVVPAPGTQILLPMVAALAPAGRAAVLAPTYPDYAPAAARAGHRVEEVADIAGLENADLAIVANPNNPDGRIISRKPLLDCAATLGARGMLVVDEAFMDVGPPGTSLAGNVAQGNIVVLRSVGKFFGLAGLRLGFALAAPDLAESLRASLGAWSVGGAAIAIGGAALADRSWAAETRARLIRAAARLDHVLASAPLDLAGGTSLFRLTRTPLADELFRHLGRAGILVRRFVGQPTWLRFGLPGHELHWQRLEAALAAFAAAPRMQTSHPPGA
jgi:cobalamin biosynthesis protein CobC